MKVLYLGHAGFRVTNQSGHSLVMDPWLSKGGAFLRSWFQFPENHFLADRVSEMSPERDMLYISHHHRDHFDLQFLKRLDKKIPVIVPHFDRKHFINELKGIGFQNIRQLDTGEIFEHHEFRARLFIDESYSNEDSGILVESDGVKFLNMNDCRAYDTLDIEEIQPVDLFTIQFSGASWFPSVYDHAPDEKARLATKKNSNKFINVRNLVLKIKPKLYVPSAGPPCFLDEKLQSFNFVDSPPFPDASQFLPLIKEVGIPAEYVFPGDHVFLKKGEIPKVESEGRYNPDLYNNKSSYIKEYATRFAENAILPSASVDQYDRLREELDKKLRALRKPLKSQHRICITLKNRPESVDKSMVLDLFQRTLVEVSSLPAKAVYHFQIENQVMSEFFSSNCLWDEFMLSLRFGIHRSPDHFNTVVLDFMRLEAEDLCLYPRKKQVGRVRVGCDADIYEIDRYCPHQGGDLTNALIVGSELICPRHGWRFDLQRDGVCIENNTSINAIRLVGDKKKTE